MKNAFASIPATKETKSKTKTQAVAEVTDTIKTNVDKFVDNKAKLKLLIAEQLGLEETIIGHVRPQQDEMAHCGSFTKSLKVPGHNYTLTFVTMDKFSIPQDKESIETLKALVGNKYPEMFETKESILIKEEVINDQKRLNKLAKACEAAGIPITDYFERTETIIAKPDLDQKQYELKSDKLEQFRTLVRQSKPALK